MIGKLITAFFNFLLSIIMTLVQLLCLPLNALFNGIFPNFSDKLTSIGNGITSALSQLSFAISIIPPIIRETLLFIFTIELSLLVIMKSTRLTSKIWTILQKIKFW